MHEYLKYEGHNGLTRASGGTQAVIMPTKTLQMIEESVIMNENLIDEREVQEVLHISKKTLCNYCASGKIPRQDFTVSVTGRRFFWLRRLLGLKQRGSKQLELRLHD